MTTQLIELLKNRHFKIATAESCTGGLLSKTLTDISGVSEVFDCGICSYSNEIKMSLLDVQFGTLDLYGAVSSQTAAEMAKGVRKISKSDIGVSTTGIAGPEGGTDNKPVGLVFVGVDSNFCSKTFELHLSGNRDSIRSQTVAFIIKTLINIL